MSDVPTADATEGGLPLRTWFDASGILVSRPGDRISRRFGVGVKGGHNAEHHNHNDVGPYAIVLGG